MMTAQKIAPCRRGLVLVVDDDADVRFAIRKVLEADGFDVAEAGNGQAALDYLLSDEEEPCLILLDLQMPVMTGDEFATIVAKYRRLSRIPIVIASVFDPLMYGSLPHEGYIRKPFAADALRAIVERLSGT